MSTDLVKVNNLNQTLNINLIKVQLLNNTEIFISDSFPCDYLGDHYEYIPNTLTGASQQEGDEESRPTWKIANPHYMFNSIVLSDTLEGALITRYQVKNLETPIPTFELLSSNVWQIYQVISINTEVVLQLRTLTDIPSARIPPRGFYPPAFPHVKV